MYVLIGFAGAVVLVLGLLVILFNRLVSLRQRCGNCGLPSALGRPSRRRVPPAPSGAATTRMAPSICAAPVIMFLI